MSWVSPPTFVAGTVCTASNLNAVSGDVALLPNSLQLTSAGTASVGVAPAIGTPAFQCKVGVFVGSTAAGGTFTVTFPSAFPNGIFGAWGINAQNSGLHWWIESDTIVTSGVSFQCMINSTTPLASSPVTVPWFAIGF